MLLLAGVVVAAVALAACGGSSPSTDGTESGETDGGSSASYIQAAEELVAEGSKPVTEFPGPYDGPVAAEGKKVLVVSCNNAAEGCKRTQVGAEEAAKAIGWEFTAMDSLGNPATASDMIGRAKALGVDGVIVVAFPSAAVQQGIEEAKEAGIFVVSAQGNTKPEGFDASATWDYKRMGELEGAWMVAESDGEAQVIRFTDPTFEAVVEDGVGMEQELAKCPGCDLVTTVQTSVATIATKAEGQCSSTFTSAKGSLNYVSGGYDALVNPFCVNGARSAGVSPEKLIFASWSGNKLNLKEVSEGNGYQRADIASSGEWAGWQAVDQLNRLFNGDSPYPQPSMAVRLLTKETITPEMLESGWQGDVDFRQKYAELWETGKTSK